MRSWTKILLWACCCLQLLTFGSLVVNCQRRFESNRTTRAVVTATVSSARTGPVAFLKEIFHRSIPLALDPQQTKVFLIAPIGNGTFSGSAAATNTSGGLAASASSSDNLQTNSAAADQLDTASIRRQSLFMLYPENNVPKTVAASTGLGALMSVRKPVVADSPVPAGGQNDHIVANDSKLIQNPFAEAPYQSSDQFINALIHKVFSDLSLQSLPPEELLFGSTPKSDKPTTTYISEEVLANLTAGIRVDDGTGRNYTIEGDNIVVYEPPTYLPIAAAGDVLNGQQTPRESSQQQQQQQPQQSLPQLNYNYSIGEASGRPAEPPTHQPPYLHFSPLPEVNNNATSPPQPTTPQGLFNQNFSNFLSGAYNNYSEQAINPGLSLLNYSIGSKPVPQQPAIQRSRIPPRLTTARPEFGFAFSSQRITKPEPTQSPFYHFSLNNASARHRQDEPFNAGLFFNYSIELDRIGKPESSRQSSKPISPAAQSLLDYSIGLNAAAGRQRGTSRPQFASRIVSSISTSGPSANFSRNAPPVTPAPFLHISFNGSTAAHVVPETTQGRMADGGLFYNFTSTHPQEPLPPAPSSAPPTYPRNADQYSPISTQGPAWNYSFDVSRLPKQSQPQPPYVNFTDVKFNPAPLPLNPPALGPSYNYSEPSIGNRLSPETINRYSLSNSLQPPQLNFNYSIGSRSQHRSSSARLSTTPQRFYTPRPTVEPQLNYNFSLGSQRIFSMEQSLAPNVTPAPVITYPVIQNFSTSVQNYSEPTNPIGSAIQGSAGGYNFSADLNQISAVPRDNQPRYKPPILEPLAEYNYSLNAATSPVADLGPQNFIPKPPYSAGVEYIDGDSLPINEQDVYVDLGRIGSNSGAATRPVIANNVPTPIVGPTPAPTIPSIPEIPKIPEIPVIPNAYSTPVRQQQASLVSGVEYETNEISDVQYGTETRTGTNLAVHETYSDNLYSRYDSYLEKLKAEAEALRRSEQNLPGTETEETNNDGAASAALRSISQRSRIRPTGNAAGGDVSENTDTDVDNLKPGSHLEIADALARRLINIISLPTYKFYLGRKSGQLEPSS